MLSDPLTFAPSAGDGNQGHPHAGPVPPTAELHPPALFTLSSVRLDFDFDLPLCLFLCEIHTLFQGAAAQDSFLQLHRAPFWTFSFSDKNWMTFFLWLPAFVSLPSFYLPHCLWTAQF